MRARLTLNDPEIFSLDWSGHFLLDFSDSIAPKKMSMLKFSGFFVKINGW